MEHCAGPTTLPREWMNSSSSTAGHEMYLAELPAMGTVVKVMTCGFALLKAARTPARQHQYEHSWQACLVGRTSRHAHAGMM